MVKYRESKERNDEKDGNFQDIYDIRDQLMENRIPCFKYNSSLSQETQKQVSYQSFLQLSKDSNFIIITNCRETEKT